MISTLEEIKKYLLNGEEISWKNVEIQNLLFNPIIEIGVGIALIVSLSLLFNYITYLMKFEEINMFFVLLYFLAPIAVLISFGIVVILPAIKKLNKIMSDLQENFKNLKRYEEITVITGKRLIQKSYNVFEIDYSQNPITDLENFEIIRDLVFINLEAIKVVIAEKLEFSYQVGFKFNLEDDNYVPIFLNIPFNKFDGFMEELIEKIPLKRKKRQDNYIINYFKNE